MDHTGVWLLVEDNLTEQLAGSLQGSCSHSWDWDLYSNVQTGNPRTSIEWASDKRTDSTAFSGLWWSFRTIWFRSLALQSIWLKRQPWRKTRIDPSPSTHALSSCTPACGNFQTPRSKAPSLAGECSLGGRLHLESEETETKQLLCRSKILAKGCSTAEKIIIIQRFGDFPERNYWHKSHVSEPLSLEWTLPCMPEREWKEDLRGVSVRKELECRSAICSDLQNTFPKRGRTPRN